MTYLWKNKNTGETLEVIRKMADSDIPPYKEEAIDAGIPVEIFAEAIWEKVITGGIGHVTFGGKGNWGRM
jgi:hypothetical protein